MASGRVVGTREIPPDQVELGGSFPGRASANDGSGSRYWLEHDRVWFPSYPYEWPAEMLFAAGALTIDLGEAVLGESFGLKDATPYNVLFEGPRPVFVDLLSFEKRDPRDPTWLPYAQFLRMFVFPLLVRREFGMGADQVFVSRAAGLEPDEVYRHCSWMKRLLPPVLTEVSIPTWLSKQANQDDSKLYVPKRLADPEKAKFILVTQLKRLRKLLRKANASRQGDSTWSGYMNTLSYSDQEFRHKTDLVQRWLSDLRPKAVLDIGCNTGHFSALAAGSGARVVGIDIDPVVVGRAWRRASAEQLDIQPLCVNLARPSPATGWRNAEYPSFLDRAAGSFELVLMLAVVHHLLVTERIPLDDILRVAAELTTKHLVLEYVSKDDPMFQRITRGREALHADFTQEAFELACQQQFTVIQKQPVKGNLRWLYLLGKRKN
ncbi:MAG TPA: class I SAM-dependent methyltransferase [Bryobacteraceae bacterium]|jgi:SAM-dependent methyltransferase|nr:class I SAM-dependent methyltransferase [Bryobacteraceae bacterium]